MADCLADTRAHHVTFAFVKFLYSGRPTIPSSQMLILPFMMLPFMILFFSRRSRVSRLTLPFRALRDWCKTVPSDPIPLIILPAMILPCLSLAVFGSFALPLCSLPLNSFHDPAVHDFVFFASFACFAVNPPLSRS